jgi:hypothetical protein
MWSLGQKSGQRQRRMNLRKPRAPPFNPERIEIRPVSTISRLSQALARGSNEELRQHTINFSLSERNVSCLKGMSPSLLPITFDDDNDVNEELNAEEALRLRGTNRLKSSSALTGSAPKIQPSS